MQAVTAWLAALAQQPFAQQLSGALRYVFPVLAVWVLLRCGRSLLQFKKEPEIWAWLATPAGDRLPVTHWENLLGRGRGCDVQLEYPTISRQHAVLTRYDDGSWSITEVGSRGSVLVNGEKTSVSAINYGDVISLGGVEVMLERDTTGQTLFEHASALLADPEKLRHMSENIRRVAKPGAIESIYACIREKAAKT